MKSYNAQVRVDTTQWCVAPNKDLLCHIVRFHGDAILFLFRIYVKELAHIYQTICMVNMGKLMILMGLTSLFIRFSTGSMTTA